MKSEERWEGGLFGESQETCHFYVDEAKASGIGLSGKFMSRMMKRLLMVGMLHVCITAVLQAQDVAKEATLQEVVVTGTGTQHLLKNAPVQTEVITHQMLRQYGAHSLQDILGALSSSFAFNEGDMGSQIQMNGLGNAYILILIDGKRLHGDNGGENDLSLIDPHNIEKIEIVKGASSALYGSDAIAGVINIITRKHDNDAFLFENTTRY
jgi:outer membrane receptor for ferrienterochelin and colicins